MVETSHSSPVTGNVLSPASPLASAGILPSWQSARKGVEGASKRQQDSFFKVLRRPHSAGEWWFWNFQFSRAFSPVFFEGKLWSIKIRSLELTFPLFLHMFLHLVPLGTTLIQIGSWDFRELISRGLCPWSLCCTPFCCFWELFFSPGLSPVCVCWGGGEGATKSFSRTQTLSQTARIHILTHLYHRYMASDKLLKSL